MRGRRLGVGAAVTGGDLVRGDVEVGHGRITKLGCAPAGRGHVLASAGLVDLHVHGQAGVDFIGLGDGTYRLGDVDVTVRHGAARNPAGALAGSVLQLIEAVRNAHELGVPIEAALRAATEVPARLVGREELGTLRTGTPADVIVIDDRLDLQLCMVDGEDASSATGTRTSPP